MRVDRAPVARPAVATDREQIRCGRRRAHRIEWFTVDPNTGSVLADHLDLEYEWFARGSLESRLPPARRIHQPESRRALGVEGEREPRVPSVQTVEAAEGRTCRAPRLIDHRTDADVPDGALERGEGAVPRTRPGRREAQHLPTVALGEEGPVVAGVIPDCEWLDDHALEPLCARSDGGDVRCAGMVRREHRNQPVPKGCEPSVATHPVGGRIPSPGLSMSRVFFRGQRPASSPSESVRYTEAPVRPASPAR